MANIIPSEENWDNDKPVNKNFALDVEDAAENDFEFFTRSMGMREYVIHEHTHLTQRLERLKARVAEKRLREYRQSLEKAKLWKDLFSFILKNELIVKTRK